MEVLIAKEIESDKHDQVSYEIQWTISNWRQVRQDVRLVRNQKAIFRTGQETAQMIRTKWQVGLKEEPCRDGTRIRVFWKLLGIKGSRLLDARIKTTLLCSANDVLSRSDEQSRHEVSPGDIIEEKNTFLDIGRDLGRNVDNTYINSNGAIEYRLVLSFKSPINNSAHNEFKRLKMEQFAKRSHDQLRKNQEALLREDSNGDLKIIASDGVELRAHQNILKVQCPVFAGMLNSNLSETQTGIVKVEDISGKTMKILLHYFYTGDLLKGWNDDDTIVEFTYAAGKYQMTQVMKLLDDLFGRGALEEVSNLDIQLLNLAGKLSLKNAERRLLQRVIGKVTAAKSSKDLFQLFGYDSEEISSNAEKLAKEQIESSNILEILDYAVGNTNQQVNFSVNGFSLLALVQRKGSLKGLEKVLLRQVAETTSKFTTAEELVKFFGGGK